MGKRLHPPSRSMLTIIKIQSTPTVHLLKTSHMATNVQPGDPCTVCVSTWEPPLAADEAHTVASLNNSTEAALCKMDDLIDVTGTWYQDDGL
ncbi:hypothetical protein IAQ61_004105 [Plenodomus lingam]|uniref:uncharacterized protein n=1 Tax=Leptosphaeria maculans TaxID=5022 RepID=UPI00332AB0F3|nr:hypothetical protein IAQ61_004105 [Plenodomus lingam]